MMRWGLRAKSALALCLCIGAVLCLAVVAGWQALRAIEQNLGAGYARNVTRYNKQRILAPVLRELVLSQRLADSEVTRRWMLDEDNGDKKALFFAEAARYQRAFEDHSYFLISAESFHYYFNDSHSKWSDKPRYSLKRNDAEDDWFFATLKKTRDFNINVDVDMKLKVTKVWFNVLVKDGNRNIGLAGTGLDLTTFLKRFITAGDAGVTPMILNNAGAIQAHPDQKLIDYSSVNSKGALHSTVYRLLTHAGDADLMREAMRRASRDAEDIHMFYAQLDGRRQLFAVSYIPELSWYVVTAVDVKAARVLDRSIWLPLFIVAVLLVTSLVLATVAVVNRILLTPLLKLTHSVRTMAAGNYAMELPPAGSDELGELTRAFGVMAEQVRSHTDELETKVQERTRELVQVNEQIAAANKQIGDSIQYASLIQNAILPDRELARSLGDSYFVLWRPKDVVGGDFYVFRADEDGCLIGVVDCAGHGVPGAFMTMIAHAALDVAMETAGLKDPASLLKQMDERVRAMLQSDPAYARLATHMDAGLAYVNLRERTVTFSGAKVSLYWCDGEQVGEIRGDRRAVAGKRFPEFENAAAALGDRTTFYLTTDGLLDQAGGPKGYSFGQARFAELMRRHAQRPFDQQKTAFAEELARYQGNLTQRDDITVLSFRFARRPEPSAVAVR